MHRLTYQDKGKLVLPVAELRIIRLRLAGDERGEAVTDIGCGDGELVAGSGRHGGKSCDVRRMVRTCLYIEMGSDHMIAGQSGRFGQPLKQTKQWTCADPCDSGI